MSLINSIFSFTIESCSCFFNKKKKKKRDKSFYENKLVSMGENVDIKVLPPMSFFPLTDIFPQSNFVTDWSVYVIGRNKKLIISQDNLELADTSMLNKRYDHVLNVKNGEFFDTVFQMIMSGHESQFLMVCRKQLYFANTYTFLNSLKKAIGGILFVRLYSSMSELVPTESTEYNLSLYHKDS